MVARAVVQARFLHRTGGTVSPAELLEAAGAPERDLTLPEWVHDWAGATRISSAAG